jgi:hypothetical protein
MRNRTYDPLTFIPSPDVLREHLTKTEELARRLRILLETSERIHGDQEEHQAHENMQFSGNLSRPAGVKSDGPAWP